MAYASSTNISVFPTVGRPDYDPQGRLTTEYNLTSLLNNLLGVQGFVITNNNEDVSNLESDFEFNIKGYIFRIHKIYDIISNFTNTNTDKIYASIELNIIDGTSGTNTSNESINNQVVQSIRGEDMEITSNTKKFIGYTGVIFDSNPPSTTTTSKTYWIQILEKRDGGWYIPDNSKVKFKTENNGMRDITIDDGELN